MRIALSQGGVEAVVIGPVGGESTVYLSLQTRGLTSALLMLPVDARALAAALVAAAAEAEIVTAPAPEVTP